MRPQVTYGRSTGNWSLGDVAVTRTRHATGLVLPEHDHEPATLAIVLDGRFRETIGRRSFDCGSGAVLLKPAGAHHSNAYAVASTALLVTLPSRFALGEVAFLQDPRAAAMAFRLRRELSAPDTASELIAEGLVLELLGMAVLREERARDARPCWLRTFAERLHDSETPRLADLAEEVGRHPSHVAREFRRHYRCSPGEYHRALRIQRASYALRTTNDSLADVAAAAGFYDQSHFTNTFRKLYGISPGKYRKSCPRAHTRSKT